MWIDQLTPMSSIRFKNLTDDQVWERWHDRIHAIRHELHFVFNTVKKFRIVTKMFETNDDLKANAKPARWFTCNSAWIVFGD